jgi:hypothetical protein
LFLSICCRGFRLSYIDSDAKQTSNLMLPSPSCKKIRTLRVINEVKVSYKCICLIGCRGWKNFNKQLFFYKNLSFALIVTSKCHCFHSVMCNQIVPIGFSMVILQMAIYLSHSWSCPIFEMQHAYES